MRKLATILIFSALLLSCHVKTVELDLPPTDLEEDTTDYTTNRYESTVILGEKYSARYKTDYFVYLYNSKDEVILAEPDGSFDISFKDYNGDNLDDFTIGYTGASRHYQKLFLFDKEDKKFREVVGFEDYSGPVKIGNTKYHFSYRSDGCASNYWISDLFYIENFTIKRIGSMYGNECYEKKREEIAEQEFKEKYTIDIKKLINGRYILIEQLDSRILEDEINSKSDFLINYWGKNYKLFDTKDNSVLGKILFSGIANSLSSVSVSNIEKETIVKLELAEWSAQFTISMPKFTGAEWKARQRNSRCYSLNDEGAHLDFISGKSQVTDWNEMTKLDDAKWQSSQFDTNDYGVVPQLSEEDIKKQLREEFKENPKDTGRWVNVSRACLKNPQSCIKDCKSEIQFYRQTGDDKEVTKSIVLMIPMGC
jgi:hypothetical protein